MHIPATPDEWTFETITGLAETGRCEGERHDFKFNLPDAQNLTKISCAFANSQGGFIVLGVKECSGHFHVEGIEPDSEVTKKFADKLAAVPSIEFSSPRLIGVRRTSKILYVFHIPRSALRPHIPQAPDKRLFWKRTPGGCEPMTYDEIQEQFLRYEERREKLKLLFIELLLNRENLQQAYVAEPGKYSLITLDTGVLDRLLVDTYSVVQGERQLIRILLTLRTQIRVTNTKAQMFFSQMALPMGGQNELAAKHNQFMKEKAEFLVPLIGQAIDILERRFGLTDPLPDEPSFGIIIRMFVEAGGPHHRPHFHAYYQDQAAVFALDTLEYLGGGLPKAQQRLVEAWAEIHREELQHDWALLQSGQPPVKIEPLR